MEILVKRLQSFFYFVIFLVLLVLISFGSYLIPSKVHAKTKVTCSGAKLVATRADVSRASTQLYTDTQTSLELYAPSDTSDQVYSFPGFQLFVNGANVPIYPYNWYYPGLSYTNMGEYVNGKYVSAIDFRYTVMGDSNIVVKFTDENNKACSIPLNVYTIPLPSINFTINGSSGTPSGPLVPSIGPLNPGTNLNLNWSGTAPTWASSRVTGTTCTASTATGAGIIRHQWIRILAIGTVRSAQADQKQLI